MDQTNVYGSSLQLCSSSPMTGWFRDGYARYDRTDTGQHTLCAKMTEDFLNYTRSMGNDLTRPSPPMFPGLKAGDCWALCAARWLEAYKAGFAPQVKLEATHEKALDIIPLNILEKFNAVTGQQNE